ncbi:A-kinase anchor protein 10, mitochondrial-like isoform X2 [Dreissena polymorpha]|uniref:A-kinase anchor protein 10, mitochondrial-like isoform X2 n=1 Tax=Dreissena polymorpha TaxID=45954 RepID=UPI002264705F|nr:A-kinase anchor protein 10, mitochondrial-like isoform X2 [Dreissena polymorpha]
MSFFRRKSDKKKADKASPKPSNRPVWSEHNGAPGFNSDIARKTELLLVEEDFHPGDLVSRNAQSEYKKYSRLSPLLEDIVRDHEAVPYLIQYLEARKASALIRFWLDAESFQASTWTRIRTHSLESVSRSMLVQEKKASSMSSLTCSVGRDITSPVSYTSDETQEDELTNNACFSNTNQNLPQINKCDNNESISDQTCSTETSQGNGHSSGVSNPDSCDTPKSLSNCDPRAREKCKTNPSEESVSIRHNLNLQLQDTCDNQSDTNSASVESALSYRDIASPSPTGNSFKSEVSGSAATVMPKSYMPSSSSLAEKLRKSVEQDAVRIFTKYLAQEATHPIGITDQLRNHTIRAICREDGQVDPECFVECQQFALNKIQESYFDGYKSSAHHCKYQVEVLTSGILHITDVMYNEQALFYFMEYLEQEGLSDLLQFLIAADNYGDLLRNADTYDGQMAQTDAMVLYDKYFSLQAAVSLGFPDNVRFEVESNICREEGPLPDCFAKPRHIVLHTLEKRYFQQYLTSDIYYKFLSELVSAVQTAQEFPLGQRRKRRGSETSSEHSAGAHSVGGESISSRNTLLAAGSSRPVQLSKLEENIRNIHMDDTLLNPDKLWERKDAGKMSLGQIDTLGQFVSQFDPDPEEQEAGKQKQGRFFRSKKDKEKEKEEMARKVAEMILKDVTSVTQAISAIKNTSSISENSKKS